MPERLRASWTPVQQKTIGVDREKGQIRGMVIAQLGPFKTPGRGEFDLRSLESIRDLINSRPNGVRSNYGHANLSNDGLGTFLGRVTAAELGTATTAAGDSVHAVRGTLTLNPTALEPKPGGGGTPLGTYVMDLAASDPDAISSSLVIKADREWRMDKGKPALDANGKELPPVWRPTDVLGSDIVNIGDAVDGLLSAGIDISNLNDDLIWSAHEMLDRFMPNESEQKVRESLSDFLSRYLDQRFAKPEIHRSVVDLDRIRKKVADLKRLYAK